MKNLILRLFKYLFSKPNDIDIAISSVRVNCKQNELEMRQLIGLKVNQAHNILKGILNLPREVWPFVNGKRVDDNYILKTGDYLVFDFPVKKG